ncbi:MAG: hypothetical protein WCB04_15295, partial [Mycobacteriales bacterium]
MPRLISRPAALAADRAKDLNIDEPRMPPITAPAPAAAPACFAEGWLRSCGAAGAGAAGASGAGVAGAASAACLASNLSYAESRSTAVPYS